MDGSFGDGPSLWKGVATLLSRSSNELTPLVPHAMLGTEQLSAVLSASLLPTESGADAVELGLNVLAAKFAQADNTPVSEA